MTLTIAATGKHSASRTSANRRPPVVRVQRIGYTILGFQLLISFAWSTLLYNRFAVTFDFSMYHQAWFLIAHGNLNPIDSIRHNYFWQDHSNFMMWPLAPLYWVWPHSVILLWLQDICVIWAEAVAFTWLCQLAQARRTGADGKWLASAGLILLVANPWTWWTLSWDFHSETIAMPFLVLLAWDIRNDRRRAWVWLLPLLASGDVAATYIAAVGLGAILAGRRWRMRGVILTCLGVGATALITLVHGNAGSGGGLQAYAYLAGAGPHPGHLGLGTLAKGIVLHPTGVLRAMWMKRLDIWATLAPAGLPGIASVWLLPLALIVEAANNLFASWLFAAPGFQGLPLYILLPVGTVAVLTWLAARHRRMALMLTALTVLQAVGYSAVFLPRTPSQWLRIPAATASTLASVEARIPGSAEVIASQGVMGRFAGRVHIYSLFGPGPLPLYSGENWFVITPTAGIETLRPADALALVAKLAGPLHATLVTHNNGVWAFSWIPPPGVHEIIVPRGRVHISAWTHPGLSGRAVMTGPVANWHVTSTGTPGYVSDGLEWQVSRGRYRALVTLSATGTVNVEVWNNTGNVLLARRRISATNGLQTISIPVNATTAYHASAYSGWGPFQAIFVQPPRGQQLEVRVWSSGSGTVNVYGAGLVLARQQPGRH